MSKSTITCLILFALEVLVSARMFSAAPTDTVRTWYPTVWSYIGEHGTVTILTWFLLLGIARIIGRSELHHLPNSWPAWGLWLFCAGLSIDVAASAYIWFVAPMSGAKPRLWYTPTLGPYLILRGVSWCVMFALIVLVVAGAARLRSRHTTGHQSDAAASTAKEQL